MNRISALQRFLLVASIGALVVGCGKTAPEGMPETVPFTVKVVDGSKGIADVQVMLESETAIGSVAGTTGSSGAAVIKTTFKNFTVNGAPTGEYKVRCIKDPVVDHWKSQEELNAMDLGQRQAYFDEWKAKCDELPREIPLILSDFDKCPCRTTVSDGGEFVVDVSEYKE